MWNEINCSGSFRSFCCTKIPNFETNCVVRPSTFDMFCFNILQTTIWFTVVRKHIEDFWRISVSVLQLVFPSIAIKLAHFTAIQLNVKVRSGEGRKGVMLDRGTSRASLAPFQQVVDHWAMNKNYRWLLLQSSTTQFTAIQLPVAPTHAVDGSFWCPLHQNVKKNVQNLCKNQTFSKKRQNFLNSNVLYVIFLKIFLK